MNAVASMTPVPKCFPMKKTIGGMCKKGISIDMAGNDTAEKKPSYTWLLGVYWTTHTEE